MTSEISKSAALIACWIRQNPNRPEVEEAVAYYEQHKTAIDARLAANAAYTA